METAQPVSRGVYQVGIDVGRFFHQAVATDGKGQVVGRWKVVNWLPCLARWVKEVVGEVPGPRRFLIEMLDGHAAPLVRYLIAEGEDVCLCHPYAVKRFRQGVYGEDKTDRIDAQALCSYARAAEGPLPRVRHVKGWVRAVQVFSRHLRWLTEEAVRTAQSLEAVLVGYCPELVTGGILPAVDSQTMLAFLEEHLPLSGLRGLRAGVLARRLEKMSRGRRGRESAEKILESVGALAIPLEEEEAICSEIRHLVGLLRLLQRQIAEQQDRVAAEVEKAPVGRALTEQMRGISSQTAALILGEVGDISAFAKESQFARFCGTAPRVNQSGKRASWTLGRQTHKRLAAALYISTLSTVRMQGPERAYLERKRKEDRPYAGKKAIIALARYRARAMYRILQTYSWEPETA